MRFRLHLLGSDRLGLGPYVGSSFDLTVLGGKIVRAGASFELEEFPADVGALRRVGVGGLPGRRDGGTKTRTGVRLSEESVRLWKLHVRDYVQEMHA